MAEKVQMSARHAGPGGMDMGAGEKSRDLKGACRSFFRYLGKFRRSFCLAALLSVAGAVLNLIGPNRLSAVTDLITAGLASSIDLPKVAGIAALLAVLYGLGYAFNCVQGLIMATISQRVTQNMRRDISVKIDRLPLSYFDAASAGDVLSRVTNDVDTVGQSMNQSFSTIVSSLALLLGSMLMMFLTNWLMALTGILAALLGFAVMMLVIARSQKYYARQQRELGVINGHAEETISGHSVVKAYNGERGEKAAFRAENDRLYLSAWKSQFLSGLMMPLMIFVGNLAYAVVCVVGAVLAVKGSITFGTIVAFMLYIRLFTQPLQNISQAAGSVQSMAAACERVFEFLAEPEMAGEGGKTKEIQNVRGDISFSHVRFGYGPERVIIRDFSHEVKAGQKIAIVGPTGAGKTTMVNLLMRFYELDGGKISIDGTNIAEVRRENVRAQFGMVLQDTWLFEGTLRENLVYNRQGVPDEKLRRVCAAAGLSDLVRQLPNGLDTMLGDNASLSAGQKQLITIARAMIEDAPLLILDEATSSVDTRTELTVQQAMDKLTEGRTSFVIAHRLSTVRNADCILVMRDGDIVESGTHDELLQRGGFYADLYSSQFEPAS